jgi:ribosomal protein L16/L10AE
MIPISQRLRARLEPVGDGSGKWRPDGLCQEAADVNDALVAALEGTLGKWVALVESGDAGFWNAEEEEHVKASRAALAKAKGKQE